MLTYGDFPPNLFMKGEMGLPIGRVGLCLWAVWREGHLAGWTFKYENKSKYLYVSCIYWYVK